MAFLYCLARLGILCPDDAPAVGLRIFPHYLDLMRKVQTTYWCAAASQAGDATYNSMTVSRSGTTSLTKACTALPAVLVCKLQMQYYVHVLDEHPPVAMSVTACPHACLHAISATNR